MTYNLFNFVYITPHTRDITPDFLLHLDKLASQFLVYSVLGPIQMSAMNFYD